MKKISTMIAAVTLMLCALRVSAAVDTKREQLIALEAIIAELDDHYGMAHYKEEMFGVKIESVAQKYRRLIKAARTLEEDAGLWPPQSRSTLSADEFRQLMIGLAAEFKDGHLNISRQNWFGSTVGIRTYAIDEKLYVGGFDPDLFTKGMTFPELQPGDEIISVDGRSVLEIARENYLYTQQLGATYDSSMNRALRFILNVPHAFLRAKNEHAPVEIEFRRAGFDETFIGTFHWAHTERLAEARWLSEYLHVRPPQQNSLRPPYIYGESSRPETYFSEGLSRLGLPFGSIQDVAEMLNNEIRKSKKESEATPVLSEKPSPKTLSQLELVNRLPAYSVRFGGKTFGVLRIPNYSPDNILNELKWMQFALEYMENSVDVLIVDQLSNGGGSVFHAWQFMKFFATTTLESGTIDMRLNETLMNFLEQRPPPETQSGAQLDGVRRNFMSMQLQREAVKAIRAKKDSGEKWSGPVSSLFGDMNYLRNESGEIVGQIGKVFSKPILILNDQYSGSGGDFVPWILQSNQRAVVMGETSMGLGGPVYRSQESMPGSELSMRCTMGLCRNHEGEAVENIGVVPDIRRPVSIVDARTGFKTFSNDVLNVAFNLAKGANPKAIQGWLNKYHYVDRQAVPPSPYQAATAIRAKLLDNLAQASENMSQQREAYRQYFTGLGEIPHEEFAQLPWDSMPVTLPAWLTALDPLIASLYRMPEISNRLGTLTLIHKFSPEQLGVISTLSRGFNELQLRRSPRAARCLNIFALAL